MKVDGHPKMVILNIILIADVYVHLITVGSNEGYCVVGEC